MPDSNTHILLWSFPIAVCIHVFEEFAFPGGLIQWIRVHKPGRLKGTTYYVAVNAATILIGVLIALFATTAVGYYLFLNFVALMAGNAASHVRASIQARQYCPGTISGVLLFVPLLVISVWSFIATGRVEILSTMINVGLGGFVGFYVFSLDVRQSDRP